MTRERLEKLLYNALTWIEEDNGNFFVSSVGDEYEWFEETLGITRAEMEELGIDWLNDGEDNEEDEPLENEGGEM